MSTKEYYSRVLERGYVFKEDLDSKDRCGILSSTLDRLKDDLNTCIKLTYNMEKSPIYKYAGFHLAGNIYEELIYMCKAILELNGISTVYYRDDVEDKIRYLYPIERDSSWVLRQLKNLIPNNVEYKQLGGVINYLNKYRIYRNYITHAVDLPTEYLDEIETTYRNILLQKDGNANILVKCFNILIKHIRIIKPEVYFKQKEFMLASLARDKVNYVFNEKVTYTKELYNKHKINGFPPSLKVHMKAIEEHMSLKTMNCFQ